jgi:hypothetical protein
MLVAMFVADLYQEMVDFGLVIDGKHVFFSSPKVRPTCGSWLV